MFWSCRVEPSISGGEAEGGGGEVVVKVSGLIQHILPGALVALAGIRLVSTTKHAADLSIVVSLARNLQCI